ncbi:Glycine-rich domain containing protein [Gracilaria domingensis]|nr:Glycine-rich domain containing protein [Gracilaria domingensis]
MQYLHATRRMTYMVKAVDLTYESMYEGPALQRSIWRYEALWLPLLAAISNPPSRDDENPIKPRWAQSNFALKVDEIRAKNFAKGGLWLNRDSVVPPLDIAWVWHCHRLNPHAYAEDLARFARDEDANTIAYMRQQACSTAIDTAFKFSDGEDSQSRPTRRLWEIIYPYEAYMPKYLLNHTYAEEEHRKRQHITSYTNEINRSTFRSVLQHDLARAALIQKSFVYQIVDNDDPEKCEYYETNGYLMRAFQRYLMFIVLHKSANELLVPMKDINVIWHMHISCTMEYENDCNALIGYVVKHDSIAVEDTRRKEVEEMEEETLANGEARTNLEDSELDEIRERRQRGISIARTKRLWEKVYGSKPRYDIPDTRYRGVPNGERGGFKEVFEKTNGTSRDISWIETLFFMALAILVFFIGATGLLYSFYKTMFTHGKFFAGLPLSVGIMVSGVYIFLAIPISRPLSSDSRYWLERAYKQTHNPLPTYLTPTSRKNL